ncbi:MULTISPECIES: alpha/beta fold hydrolase [Rhodococcus]|jgi:pimeloyl-ACP methyl ester carboxylesterase|uniref:Uncharacterized protein n=1 Tax=Rhodococcus jostii TaxID=132919 RepID=A0ABU4C754_RHOJO|nr:MULTISPECIES: hypothetical protein [Rhodococcus]MDH6291776.1 pimeloyl-ACP methyl ester carboxylesterase [Rhodococcus opacus]MDI9953757.1 hypothetical protein [Rhodococcus sp. IEGM 1305]MDV6279373.1 hypothetical protein [Rhodococcus jostii]
MSEDTEHLRRRLFDCGDPELGAARAREHIPSVEVEIYPGIGHDLLWANPEQVIPRFLDFTDSHDPVRS